MRSILKTTLAAAFATACISGATVTFAAGMGGNNTNNNNNGQHSISPNKAMNNNDSDVLPTDPNTTGSIKCNNNSANAQSGCNDTNGTDNGAAQQ
jgi:hypothetical protein